MSLLTLGRARLGSRLTTGALSLRRPERSMNKRPLAGETMRKSVRGVATLAAVWLALAGCSVSDGDIEHWKHTQRGPRKITTILVEARYPQPLRVRAARALIEMRQHPNANGLDLLRGGLQSMAASDREPIVHELLPELQTMMNTGGNDGGTTTSGPSENQIRAKDAAYVLLLGDGHNSFASTADRAALANQLLDWVLTDFNQRALAGSYTAEQIVNAIGPTAADRLTQAINSSDQMMPVVVDITRLINGVATPSGKTAATERLVAVARELDSQPMTQRLDAMARTRLTAAGRPVTPESVNRTVEFFRNTYFMVLFEAIKILGQPGGTTYLLQYASTGNGPLDRRKAALTAVTNAVNASHTATLLTIARCTPAPGPNPGCDVELRGIAVDRIGETHDRTVVPTLFQLFDENNGTTADQGYVVRWKLGESILRLGGATILPEFMQHLGRDRGAGFAGFTFVEINGEAQAIGDMNPAPRDAMRGYVVSTNPLPVRALAMMFLGIKGEQRDLDTLQGMTTEATPVTGEGWSDAQLTTIGAVARRAREGLQSTLRQGQATH